jgi:hypothetical protein
MHYGGAEGGRLGIFASAELPHELGRAFRDTLKQITIRIQRWWRTVRRRRRVAERLIFEVELLAQGCSAATAKFLAQVKQAQAERRR